MKASLYTQLLDLCCGGLLLTAALALWRVRLEVVVRVFVVQGVALAGLGAVLAVYDVSVQLWAVAAGLLVLRAGVLPYLMRRAAAGQPPAAGGRPLVAGPVTLLAAAGLTLLAFLVSRPLVELAPAGELGAAGAALPVGVAVVLIGFFVLATRRGALPQLAGLLLMDNGITAVALLAGAGLGRLVEVGVALDVLLVLVILRLSAPRTRETVGDTDLDELRELRDS
jgi:hydrogenase-4 component E